MKCNGLEAFLGKIRAGETPLGIAITFTDSAVTELACASGFDFMWFDGEHGEFGRENAMQHLMAVKGTDCASFYRVPACDHTEIKRVIDFAPAGIIVPMVLDENDAARAVSYCRYPIHGGTRGVGPRRGHNERSRRASRARRGGRGRAASWRCSPMSRRSARSPGRRCRACPAARARACPGSWRRRP